MVETVWTIVQMGRDFMYLNPLPEYCIYAFMTFSVESDVFSYMYKLFYTEAFTVVDSLEYQRVI